MFNWELRDPWFLLLLVAVPLVYWCLRRAVARVQYSSLALVEQLPGSWRTRLGWLAPTLLCLGLIALIVAVARPRIPDAQTRVSREGIAIMMVVDRSSSMNARDLVRDDTSLDRLSVVKDVFAKFVLGEKGETSGGRPDDMIGLVTFAGFADSICPLTSDHGNLTALVRQLEIVDDRREDGTAIGDGLGLAVERLRQSPAKSKVAILLTDGVNNAGVIDPKKAAALAAANGIKVYCIGAGTNGIAPVPVRDPLTNRVVLRGMNVEIDEQTLEDIAAETGGQYFRATDAEALTNIYGQIGQLEKTEVEEVRYLNYTEYFTRFVVSGLALLAAAVLLAATVFRRAP